MFQLSGFCCKATIYPGSSLTSCEQPSELSETLSSELQSSDCRPSKIKFSTFRLCFFFFFFFQSTEIHTKRMPCKDRDTQGEKNDHMQLEAEIGVLLPWTKEHLGSPEAGREMWGFSLESSENVLPHCHIDFRLLASGTVREYISLFHPTQSVTLYYNRPRKLIQVVWMLNGKKKSYGKMLNKVLHIQYF